LYYLEEDEENNHSSIESYKMRYIEHKIMKPRLAVINQDNDMSDDQMLLFYRDEEDHLIVGQLQC
jgi:hypothetical protein